MLCHLILLAIYALHVPGLMASTPKGKRIELKTFKNYGPPVLTHIGYRVDGDHVVEVWCKLCSQNKGKLVAHPNLRGAARESLASYTDGTTSVSKSNILRHLNGKAHGLSLMLDTGRETGPSQPEDGDADGVDACPPFKQPRIDSYVDKTAQEVYTKLMRTAYELAIHAMPLNTFKVLVSVQKKNGVKLLESKDCNKFACELICCLSDVIKNKIAELINNSKAFSVLSDGSQSRKTGADKELIFVRLVRDGVPVYYAFGLEDLAEHGGANADGIKAAHEKIFSNVDELTYLNGLVACTADGASVNFGRWRGFLAQIATNRPWLQQIHCVNHKAELAAKAVFENTGQFKEVDELYEGIRNLLKNSGRLKAEVKNTCALLNITHYTLSKIHGTRFQHQRRVGFKKFTHMLIPLCITFENCLSQPSGNYRAETKAKVTGYLRKLKRFDVIVNLCIYLDILESIGALSLAFEQTSLLVSDVEPARDKVLGQLSDLAEKPSADIHFQLHTHDDGSHTIEKTYPCMGHERKQPANRVYTTHSINVTHVSDDGIGQGDSMKAKVIEQLKDKFLSRYDSFDDPIIQAMMFVDPKHWNLSDKCYGEREVLLISDVFDTTLELSDYDRKNILSEWHSFKRLVQTWYPKHSASALWPLIFRFRSTEYPNLCKLVTVILCISASNSSVERGFSALTYILNDNRLSLKHSSLEALVLVKVNHSVWTEQEREYIISTAVKKYLQKRRTKRVFSEGNLNDSQAAFTSHPTATDNIEIALSSSDTEESDFSETD